MFVVRFAILWHILNNFSQWFVLRKTPTKSFVCLFTVKSCNPYYDAIVSVSIVSSFVDYSRKQQNSDTQKKWWSNTFAPPPPTPNILKLYRCVLCNHFDCYSLGKQKLYFSYILSYAIFHRALGRSESLRHDFYRLSIVAVV